MTEQKLTEAFEYLDRLRASGRTNMFGAPQYMVVELGMDKYEAKDVWKKWVEVYDGETPAAELARKVLG